MIKTLQVLGGATVTVDLNKGTVKSINLRDINAKVNPDKLSEWQISCDSFEMFVLAMAIAGFDIESKAFQDAADMTLKENMINIFGVKVP